MAKDGKKKKSEGERQSVFEEAPTLNELKHEGNTYMLSWFDFITSSIRNEIKRKPRDFFILFVIAFAGSVVITSILLNVLTSGISVGITVPNFSYPNFSLPTFQASTVSKKSATQGYDPVLLLEKIRSGADDYVLIDVRAEEDYESGHIKTAVNVPVYGTEIIKENGSLDRGLLTKQARDKIKGKSLVIVYGDSQYSSIPSEVASVLGNKVSVLAIGWNEWAHFRNLWIPERMWDDINIEEYVQIKEN